MKLIVVAAVSCIAVLVAGCRSSKPRPASLSAFLSNDRLKSEQFPDEPIEVPEYVVVVDGMWMPSPTEPEKSLVFPEQVRIICTQSDMNCRVSTVTLGAVEGMVKIDTIDAEDYPIDTWDKNSIHASMGADKFEKPNTPNRCHRHAITISFESGAVIEADVPTGEKGCETFSETNTYRLVRGNYYVDTTPANNLGQSKETPGP
jgi:hypothetical protein